MMDSFEYALGDNVTIERSNEVGMVEGRTQYLHYPNSFFVRYTSADGRAVEGWFSPHELRKS